MKNTKYLSIEIENGIGILKINKPPVNVLNAEILNEFNLMLDFIENNKDIRVVIIASANEKSFIAGADIKEMSTKTETEGMIFAILGHNIMNKIENLSKPVIAAVNGHALGGGLELAMACDIIIGTENSTYGQPEVGVGVIPGFGGTQRLPTRVGINIAKEMILTGRAINAEEAYRIRLINKVVKQQELLETAKSIAKEIIEKSPNAVKVGKYVINEGVMLGISDGLEIEKKNFSKCFLSHDQKEGMHAFIEKRKPKF